MVRLATIDDGIRISEIHIFSWRYAYHAFVENKLLFNKYNVLTRLKSFEEHISNGEEYYVYENDGIVKGFMTVDECRDEDKKDAFELWRIYIDPIFMGMGIGSTLITEFETLAVERERTELVVWVLKKNESWINFYKKHGYSLEGKEQ